MQHSTERSILRRIDGATVACLAGLFLAVLVLEAVGYRGEDFWWPDSPRHAMGGALVHDFVTESSLTDPLHFAERYYLRYPAFSVGLYPPGFYVLEGGMFALFGISEASALAVVGLLYFAGGAAVFYLARLWLGRVESFAVALLSLCLPEVAFWGREVMLDVPMCALLLVGIAMFIRRLDDPDRNAVYWSVLPLVGAVYIKYNAAFVGPLLAAVLVSRRGWRELQRPAVWAWGAVAVILLAPAAALMAALGRFNVTQAVEVGPGQGAALPLDSFRNWTYYLEQLPAQAGWETVALAAAGLALILWRPRLRDAAPRAGILLAWFGFGYLVFSLIALKEQRHTMTLLVPVLFAAALFLRAVLPARALPAVLLAWAFVRFGVAVAQPLPTVAGYCRAADDLARLAKPESVVMFFGTGRGNGNVAFRLRSRHDEQGLTLYRGDKMLFSMSSNISTIRSLPVSHEDIGAKITSLGIEYVVVESAPFLDKLDNTGRLLDVLRSRQFELVTEYDIQGSNAYHDNHVAIYRNRAPLPKHRSPIDYDIPLADFSIGEHH